MIEKYLRSYRNAFTLRRAPFLLCYAAYSAVTVILRQERRHRGQFMALIPFFWTCLSELQRGCNFGMKKPLAVLRDMVREYDISLKESVAEGEDGGSALQAGLDESIFFQLTIPAQQPPDAGPGLECAAGSDGLLQDSNTALYQPDLALGTSASDLVWHIDDREKNMWHDTLYGLFTSPLPIS
jgi:hypothetical protein